MRKLIVFNSVSLDGYFTDSKSDMTWAHKNDPEWLAFVEENARSGGQMLFGRKTYEMMASFWPTPAAAKLSPVVAEAMNKQPKVVFSTTLVKAHWANTRLLGGNLVEEVQKLKKEPGDHIVVMGSGTIVSQLARAGLVDEYQMVVNPIVLGSGRTMFEESKTRVPLKLERTRTFGNGNVLLCYEPAR